MKTHIRYFGVLVLGFLSCALRAADPVWLQFPKGNTFALAERDGDLSVRIPLVFDSKAPFAFSTLSVQLVDASIESKREDALFNAVTPELRPPSGILGPTLNLKIGKAAPRAASYRVEVQFLTSGPPPALLQTAIFVLNAGIPKLAAPSSLNVNVVLPLFLGEPFSDNQVTLRETSRFAAFNHLTVKDVSLHGEANNTGQLVTNTPTTLGANQVLHLDLIVNGDFPLGAGAGTLQVAAQELTEPVLIPYTVKARRPYFWIAVVSVAGFVLGYFSRVYLKFRKELDAVRRAALELAELIRGDLNNPDKVLQSKLCPLLLELRAAARGINPTRIQTLITSVQGTRTGLLADIDKARTDIASGLAEIDGVASQQWLITPASTWVENLRAELSRIEKLRIDGDVTQAKQGLAALNQRGLVALVVNLQGWQRAVAAFLDGVPKVLPSVSSANLANFSMLATDWKSKYPTPLAAPTSVSTAELKAALQKAHEGWAELDALRENLRRWIEDAAGVDAASLSKAGAPKVDFLPAVRNYWKALGAEFEQPKPDTGNLATTYAVFTQEWMSALTAILRPDADTKEIQGDATVGKWQDAITAAIALFTGTPRATVANLLGPKGSAPVTDTAPPKLEIPEVSQGKTLTGRPYTARPTPTIAELEASEKWAGYLQTLIAAILFLCGMYLGFRDSWIGTGSEMFKVFLAAYSADFATEALMNAFKK